MKAIKCDNLKEVIVMDMSVRPKGFSFLEWVDILRKDYKQLIINNELPGIRIIDLSDRKHLFLGNEPLRPSDLMNTLKTA